MGQFGRQSIGNGVAASTQGWRTLGAFEYR
jgi:hypothetical protein